MAQFLIAWAARFDHPGDREICRRDLMVTLEAGRRAGVSRENLLVFAPSGLVGEHGFHLFPPTRASLERELNLIALRAETSDNLVMVVANHGRKEGIVTRPDQRGFRPGPEWVSPGDLRGWLAPFRGHASLIFAICHSDIFGALGTECRDVYLVASESSVRIRDEDYDAGLGTPFLARMLTSWPSTSLCDAFVAACHEPREVDTYTNLPVHPVRAP